MNTISKSTYLSILVVFLVSCLCTVTTAFAQSSTEEPSATSELERYEVLFWSTIKDSGNPEEFEAYMQSFPDGKFFRLAQIRSLALREESQQTEDSQVTDQPVEIKITKDAPEPEPTLGTAKISSSGNESDSANTLTSSGDGVSFKDCAACPEMVDIPYGGFIMGSKKREDSASPPHEVTFDYWFSIGRYEVTKQQWNVCVAQGACQPNNRNADDGVDFSDRQPAVNISWEDTQDYVAWLSALTEITYRLPSEAEWEFVARAGSDTTYWWGDTMNGTYANCVDCGGNWEQKQPAEIDAFPANAFGVHGTAGGVSEWTQDCWFLSHTNAPADGSPRTRPDCTSRVLRGGAWRNDASYLRSASRINYDYNVRYITNGFRVVREKK